MKNIHAKLFTFGLLTVVFVVAFLANQMAGATDWHFGGYATSTAAPTASPTSTAVINTTVSEGLVPSGTATTVAVPAGTKAGDRLFLALEANGACSTSTLQTWQDMTQMFDAGNGGQSVTSGWQWNALSGWFGSFTKVASAADASSGTYTVTCGSTRLFRYAMFDITRADGITPNIDQLLQGSGASSTTASTATFTTLASGEVILNIGDFTTAVATVSTTNGTSLFSGEASTNFAASYLTKASPGTTTAGTFSETGSSAHPWATWAIGFY